MTEQIEAENMRLNTDLPLKHHTDNNPHSSGQEEASSVYRLGTNGQSTCEDPLALSHEPHKQKFPESSLLPCDSDDMSGRVGEPEHHHPHNSEGQKNLCQTGTGNKSGAESQRVTERIPLAK